ncbi:MAG: hypothetical protein ACLPXT_00470 [Terracidiphilus sp.]
MTALTQSAPQTNQELATSLAKLWPHREHEASSFIGIFCRLGLHWWRSLNTAEIAPHKHVRFCFWCSVVKIDGHIYTP